MSLPDDESRTDEAWREIVDNYGERASLADLDEPAARVPESDEVPEGGPEDVAEEADTEPLVAREDRFVPPTAPPVGRPRTWQRALAWLGLVMAPVLWLLMGVTDFYVPALLALLLVASFTGGFVYLISSMRKDPRDPWDDGSRV